MKRVLALVGIIGILLGGILGASVMYFSQPKAELPVTVMGESSPFVPLAKKVQMVPPKSSSDYSAGDEIAHGKIELLSRGKEPYALALWADPIWSLREPFVEIVGLQAALLGGEGSSRLQAYGPPRSLSSPNDLVILPNEQYLLTFAVRVSPFSSVGEISEVDVKINHLATCESDEGIILCLGKR